MSSVHSDEDQEEINVDSDSRLSGHDRSVSEDRDSEHSFHDRYRDSPNDHMTDTQPRVNLPFSISRLLGKHFEEISEKRRISGESDDRSEDTGSESAKETDSKDASNLPLNFSHSQGLYPNSGLFRPGFGGYGFGGNPGVVRVPAHRALGALGAWGWRWTP
ncbi:unnamed protein product [Plutella xylostella]|uniref:(diamondback moth) hypothetical protein n=1 Tax=Plutella xylostella TaxID=51655 RepID=A0A8S4G4Y2_PLUXY|nr:unnamed protein product [Plutella xylostella]